MHYTLIRLKILIFSFQLIVFIGIYILHINEASARVGDGACQVIQRVQRRPIEFNRKMRQGIWLVGDHSQTRYTVYFNPCNISIYEEVRPNQGFTIPPAVIQQFIKAQQEAAEGTHSFKHYFPGEVFDYAGQKMVLEKNMEAYLAPKEGILILVRTGEDPYAIAMGREWVQYRQHLRSKSQPCKPTQF